MRPTKLPSPRARREPATLAVVDQGWRDALQSRFREATGQTPQATRSACYRIGDALVEIVSDHLQLLAEFETFYGDCAEASTAQASCHLRVTAVQVRGSQLLALTFSGTGFKDLLDIALGPYRFLRGQPFVVATGPGPGWRLLLNANAPDRFLVASDTRTALVNLAEIPGEFVSDCIVSVAQHVQSDVLFMHAASVGVDGAGALLLGASHAGKSTNALALALRGNTFLGDDVAAVRLATREILPVPKSAGLREGPLMRQLEARLQGVRHVRLPGRDGVPRDVVRVGDLFPASKSGPLPLRFAFVLGGLTGIARITAFNPGYADLMRLRGMVVIDTNPVWGQSAGRDLMELLKVLDVLRDLRCYLVDLGTVEETARQIEETMRA